MENSDALNCPMSYSSPTSGEESLSTTVVEAVAARRGVEPAELSERLFEVVDPEALDSLFSDRDGVDGTITFTYCGYEVTATARGDVSVET